ncbi:MAG: universal stress protein [Bacteroidales bacterium]|nr:universal stress protein [Bacteroidales bacterium]
MYQLDHILVCLDLSEMDDFLIRYGNFLAEKFKPKSITFMHVMRTYDIPKEILSTLPDLDAPLSEIVREDIKEKIDLLFNHQENVETKVEVQEGATTETIVHYSQKNPITLTLMGKKLGYKGRGSVVRKVLSVSPSSVLLISETSPHKIENVLVRMDFSRMAGMALKMALRLQELTQAKIFCHHVYKLPLEYFPQYSRSKQEEEKLRQMVKNHSEKEYKKFMKRLKLDPGRIPCTSTLDTENEEAHILYTKALNMGADLVIIGSKVKSELTDVILDNTSEELAGAEKNIPVFVVKDRKQTMGFLKTMFDLRT